jgi:hypothetical protein
MSLVAPGHKPLPIQTIITIARITQTTSLSKIRSSSHMKEAEGNNLSFYQKK